jgi:hypothetical protein
MKSRPASHSSRGFRKPSLSGPNPSGPPFHLPDLVCVVAMINAANRLAVIVHQQGGSYEPGMFTSLAS